MFRYRVIIFCVCVAVVNLLSIGRPLAADIEKPDEVNSGAPARAMEWYVAPRFWHFVNSANSYRPTPNGVFATEQFRVPMYGFSLGFRHLNLPNTIFTLTAFQGEASGQLNALNQLPSGVLQSSWNQQYVRNDAEFLAQTSFNAGYLSWILGARYETADLRVSGLNKYYAASNSGLTVAATSWTDEKLTSSFYSAKAGLGGFVPLTADGRHRLFGNMMALWGVSVDVSSAGQTAAYRAGVDMSFGYQWIIHEMLSLDVRYRFLGYQLYGLQNAPNSQETDQGPSAGLTAKW